MVNLKKMTDKEQKKLAKEFVERWKERCDEKKDTQSFWLDLLQSVYGVEYPAEFINFEKTVQFENSKKFADGYIRETRILVEQKSGGVDLAKGELQSDGVYLRPDQQARRYANNMPVDERPKYIITSNFKEIWIYDENRPHSDPEKILLKDLPKEYYRLQFIVDTGNVHIKKEMELSIKAGEIIGEIYNAIREQYDNPNDDETLKSLNKLCVRLVFCFYAEDAGLFGKKSAFHDYLEHYDADDLRGALKDLFAVLNQESDVRDKYLKPELASFPYVNGGLFDDEEIEIPQFTDEIRDLILEKASNDFDWSEISPTIFGAVFESTLNPETRRKGGMHYTSIENIHKVIDPLFYDDLCKEFEKIKSIKVKKTRDKELDAFRDKMAGLKFLDPACGSGNFLTETYLSLRRLENEAIQLMQGGKTSFGFLNPIKVHISQFYGIEINDFAVTVAKTALWIAESQMMQETERIMQQDLDFLPLKSYSNIVEGNALRVDWNSVVPADELNYIMGNPPFVGTKMQSASQKKDMKEVFFNNPKYKKLDYVAAWYKKSADYICDSTNIRCALVSTNSIAQGEMVPILWKQLMNEYGIKIDFAHLTFRWDSESNLAAHVHCVIIGFSHTGTATGRKHIFIDNKSHYAQNINAYLMNAPTIFIEKRQRTINGAKAMTKGAQLIDDGNYVLNESEKNNAVKSGVPTKYIRKYLNAQIFINNNDSQYCLYLEEMSPKEINTYPFVKERVLAVKKFREESDAEFVHNLMNSPSRYFISTVPNGKFLIFPIVSSERRKYLPIGFSSEKAVLTNALNFVEKATLYDFGVSISNVHMAWTRAFCGRLKSDYRYSKDIVWNTFPWPKPTAKQKEKIEKTAQGILDARAKYPNSSLADLYDETTMPPELVKAHQANDRAVMEAYKFWGKLNSESDCVAELMKMYQRLVDEKQ